MRSPAASRAPDPTYGAVNLVASAFARYSYPEAFFLWSRERGGAEPVFFYRRDRPVRWNAAVRTRRRFP